MSERVSVDLNLLEGLVVAAERLADEALGAGERWSSIYETQARASDVRLAVGAEREFAAGPTYKIVRFFKDGRPPQERATGLTLAQAREHCQRDDTHGDGWFDGYNEEEPDQDTLEALAALFGEEVT